MSPSPSRARIDSTIWGNSWVRELRGRKLTESYARERTKLIKAHTTSYHLSLELAEGIGFSGSVLITFELGKLGRRKDLYIEYAGKEVHALKVN